MANKHIVTVQQMKVLEAAANEAGYSFAEMMQSAGSGVANFIDSNFRQSKPGKNTCFALIGPGNNGGDALVALTDGM
ncbi:MAG TPA: NAD(P)H-hydrate epimerase [Bellilinea sp.]|nr:NAD(P)H-hydrate epimerase [Bellilinea sp.]